MGSDMYFSPQFFSWCEKGNEDKDWKVLEVTEESIPWGVLGLSFPETGRRAEDQAPTIRKHKSQGNATKVPRNLRPKAECHPAPFLQRTPSPWGYLTAGTLRRASTIREWASSIPWAALLPGLSIKHRIWPVVFGRFHLYLLSLLSPVKEHSKWFSDIDFLLFLNRNWRCVYTSVSLSVKWGHLCDLIHRVVWINLYEILHAKQRSQSLLNK